MYTIGLDLAVQAAHKAVVTDEQGGFITPVLTLRTRTKELDQLLTRARNGRPDTALRVVMEPTGMAWFPVAVYLVRHDVTVYLVNSQEVADLRRYYKRHAKSDRIDARVLARLPLVNPEKLHRLHLPSAKALVLTAQLRTPTQEPAPICRSEQLDATWLGANGWARQLRSALTEGSCGPRY